MSAASATSLAAGNGGASRAFPANAVAAPLPRAITSSVTCGMSPRRCGRWGGNTPAAKGRLCGACAQVWSVRALAVATMVRRLVLPRVGSTHRSFRAG